MRFDHVILAAPDLDAAAARLFDRHGLDSVAGGEHPGFGTGNRIVPLGDGYLELMGVVDRDLARDNLLGRRVLSAADAWLGWCLTVDDADAVAQRLGLAVAPMSRRRPDGSELSWRLAGLDASLRDPQLPFFISWDDPSLHPGLETAEHRVEPHGIAWIEIAGERKRIGRWIEGADLDVRVCDGDPGVRSVGITTGGGAITL
ncbi:MAG: VOC family protein [Solirubrobacterales bacterium]